MGSVTKRKTAGSELTDILEDLSVFVENDMEVPASTQRANRRFDTVAFATNDFDFGGAVFAFRVGCRDPTNMLKANSQK